MDKRIIATAKCILKRTVRFIGPVVLGLIMVLGAVSMLLAFPVEKTNAAPNPVPPYPNQTEALTRAVEGMITTWQNTDGGYGRSYGAAKSPSQASPTADAILAIAAANYSPLAPVGWMRTHAISVANFAARSGGAAGKVVLALHAACQDPRNFEGYNFVFSVTNHLSPTGQFKDVDGVSAFRQAQAILALKAVSETIPVSATHWLTSQQLITGSWDRNVAWGVPNGSNDSTAMAIMALVAAGIPANDLPIISATNFLSNYQRTSGGFEDSPGGMWSAENAPSTAYAYQALLALGENVGAGGRWDKGGGKTPMYALLDMQDTTGVFKYFGAINDNSTYQAIPAVADKVFPFRSCLSYLPLILKN